MTDIKPRKFVIKSEFKDICEELDYDPSFELVNRRNELSDEAETYMALANEAAELPESNPEHAKVSQYLDIALALANHVEQIDFKLMPYLYARKTSMAVTDPNGLSLFGGFIEAVEKAGSLGLPSEAPVHH